MIETHYYKLKLFISPFNAICAAIAAHPSVPEWLRTSAGILGAGGIALWGLVNEVPKPIDKDNRADRSISDQST